MIKLLGRVITGNNYVREVLRGIYGIGYSRATQICNNLLIHRECRIQELPREKIDELDRALEQMEVGPKLKAREIQAKKKIAELGTIRAQMLQAGLPVNGQRYSSNAKTAKKLNPGRFH